MPAPLIVTVPHGLGAVEAKRRLEDGLRKAQGQFSSVIERVDRHWQDDSLTLEVVALGRRVSARIDVMDDLVRVEVELPWALAVFARRVSAHLERAGTKLLGGP